LSPPEAYLLPSVNHLSSTEAQLFPSAVYLSSPADHLRPPADHLSRFDEGFNKGANSPASPADGLGENLDKLLSLVFKKILTVNDWAIRVADLLNNVVKKLSIVQLM